MPRVDYCFLKLANGISLYGFFSLAQHNKMNKEYKSAGAWQIKYISDHKVENATLIPTQLSFLIHTMDIMASKFQHYFLN